jgi:predicted nucleic-acid-binding Zn-ribbon protein
VRHVPGFRCGSEQRQLYQKPEHRRAGPAGTSSHDILFDIHCAQTPGIERPLVMPEDIALAIDVEKRTTRGRSCPRCGGKIIPSDRAVYQSGDPNEIFPVWQCERCGYEEISEKAKPAGKPKR